MATRSTLPAKLTRPSGAGLLARERLLRSLDRKRDGRCIWVAGPAGAGKTSLISNWLETSKHKAVWYQIDAGDEDPATVFHYFHLLSKTVTRKRIELPHLTPEYLPALALFVRRFFEAFLCAFQWSVRAGFRQLSGSAGRVILRDDSRRRAQCASQERTDRLPEPRRAAAGPRALARGPRIQAHRLGRTALYRRGGHGDGAARGREGCRHHPRNHVADPRMGGRVETAAARAHRRTRRRGRRRSSAAVTVRLLRNRNI